MTAATNRRNRRAQARTRRRAGASWSARSSRRRAQTTTFTYSDPMFLTAVDGPSGRLATYVYDSESKRRRVYEGAAFTTIVWDGWDYLQWRRPSGTHVFHTMNGEIVGESVGGTVRDYLLDPLGSVVATLDGEGIVDQFEYWPYGELVDELPEGAPVFLWVGGLGYWFDTDHRRYVRHRMLRTDLGSWMQLDPLWPQSPSTLYAADSPCSVSDLQGLAPPIAAVSIPHGVLAGATIAFLMPPLPVPDACFACFSEARSRADRAFNQFVEVNFGGHINMNDGYIGNALAHCNSACEGARACGRDCATSQTDKHETWLHWCFKREDTEIDVHNNTVGIDRGLNGPTPYTCMGLCMVAALEGKLRHRGIGLTAPYRRFRG